MYLLVKQYSDRFEIDGYSYGISNNLNGITVEVDSSFIHGCDVGKSALVALKEHINNGHKLIFPLMNIGNKNFPKDKWFFFSPIPKNNDNGPFEIFISIPESVLNKINNNIDRKESVILNEIGI